MIQCKDCEFFESRPDGARLFKCDPFINIKEPECLAKWHLMRIEMLLAGYRSMTAWQEKMAPMQDKIFRYIKQELDDIDEADSWKFGSEDKDTPTPDDFNPDDTQEPD